MAIGVLAWLVAGGVLAWWLRRRLPDLRVRVVNVERKHLERQLAGGSPRYRLGEGGRDRRNRQERGERRLHCVAGGLHFGPHFPNSMSSMPISPVPVVLIVTVCP